MRIRRKQVRDILHLSFIDVSGYDEPWTEKQFQHAPAVLVAVSHKPLGFVAWRDVGDGLCVIDKLAVSPRERFKGIGTRLLQRAKRDSKSRRVQIEAPLQYANWLLKRGFLAIRVTRELHGIDYVLMECQIQTTPFCRAVVPA